MPPDTPDIPPATDVATDPDVTVRMPWDDVQIGRAARRDEGALRLGRIALAMVALVALVVGIVATVSFQRAWASDRSAEQIAHTGRASDALIAASRNLAIERGRTFGVGRALVRRRVRADRRCRGAALRPQRADPAARPAAVAEPRPATAVADRRICRARARADERRDRQRRALLARAADPDRHAARPARDGAATRATSAAICCATRR